MAEKTTIRDGGKSAKPGRADRLKAALKANMGRRKAQARARAEDGGATVADGPDDTSVDKRAEKRADKDQAGEPADN